jgi:uncharacterized protein
MGGTLLNIITVLVGSTVGILVGNRLPARMRESVVTGLGLVTLFVGIANAGETGNVVIPLLSIAIGAIVGELLRIDRQLERLAGWLQARFGGDDKIPPVDNPSEDTPQLDPRERFITGFVTASLVFCVGPLTILGSVQDGMGLQVGFDLLVIKSVLDGFAGMAFAASFGIGVTFSVLTIFFFQGGLALLGAVVVNVLSDVETLETTPAIREMTATGGIVLIGLALVLLDVKQPRVANFLPALVIAPALVGLASLFGIEVYPL